MDTGPVVADEARITAAMLAADFLEVALQTLVCVCGVYPEELFVKALKFGVPVFTSRHPKLCEYFTATLTPLARLMASPGQFRVVLTLSEPSHSESKAATAGSASSSSNSSSSAARRAQGSTPCAAQPLLQVVFDLLLPMDPGAAERVTQLTPEESGGRGGAGVQYSLQRDEYGLPLGRGAGGIDPASLSPADVKAIIDAASAAPPLSPVALASLKQSLGVALLRLTTLESVIVLPAPGAVFALTACADSVDEDALAPAPLASASAPGALAVALAKGLNPWVFGGVRYALESSADGAEGASAAGEVANGFAADAAAASSAAAAMGDASRLAAAARPTVGAGAVTPDRGKRVVPLFDVRRPELALTVFLEQPGLSSGS